MPKPKREDWDKLFKEEGIRVKHLRSDSGKLVGTIVYQEDGDIVSYGAAIPKEGDKVTAERGRTIAYGRFKKRLRDRPREFTCGGYLYPTYADRVPTKSFRSIFNRFYGTKEQS